MFVYSKTNIRWLLGVNRAYTKETATTHTTTNTTTTQVLGGEMFTESMQDEQTVTYPNTRFFGFDLGYDKISGVLINGQSYTAAQYNGNIAGMVWKNVYDSCVRKYDFTYDAANRLSGASFNQYTGTTFNKTAKVDYSVSNLSYDNNGNIGTMTQKGLLPTVDTSNTIDQLTYTYETGSNKLAKVADAAPIDTAQHLGDFIDGTNSGDDYAYDVNGNLISDLNKKIGQITYNYLNLPEVIRVTGKGSIYYTYDAEGNKLKKRTVDSTVLPAKTIATLYIENAVYQNDTLQFFNTSEGRARPNSTITGGFLFDYFLKDHLGNTRMAITDDYNVASPVLEATSYYPFGLQQKGIGLEQSSGFLHTKKKYNGIEFDQDLNLDSYEAFYRNLDPQIGRFWQIDPESENLDSYSPYESMGNNPILDSDPLGNWRHRFGAWLWSIFNGGGKIGKNKIGEYYVTNSFEGNSKTGPTIWLTYGKGRDKYSAAKEEVIDEIQNEETIKEWTRDGIWDPNLPDNQRGKRALSLGLVPLVPVPAGNTVNEAGEIITSGIQHGTDLHWQTMKNLAEELAAQGETVYLNKEINTALKEAIVGVGKWRPDVLSVSKGGVITITEVISPSQTAQEIIAKTLTMGQALKNQGYNVITKVVDEGGKIVK